MITFPRIEIREMLSSHVDEVFNIQQKCKLSFWKNSDYIDELTRNDSLLLIAKINIKIVGFLVSRFFITNLLDKNKERIPPQLEFESEAEILNFGVLEEFQKRGIGNLLFDGFLLAAHSRMIKTIWLEVRITNQDAVKFYNKRDFIKIQTRKNFYTNPSEDAVIMKRDLSVDYIIK